MRVQLLSTTAVAARREAAERFPQGGNLYGFPDEPSAVADVDPVYITAVRERGNKASVATAVRNRHGRARVFVFVPSPSKTPTTRLCPCCGKEH